MNSRTFFSVLSEGKKSKTREQALWFVELCDIVMCSNQRDEYRDTLKGYYAMGLEEERREMTGASGNPVVAADSEQAGKIMMSFARQFMKHRGLRPHDEANGR